VSTIAPRHHQIGGSGKEALLNSIPFDFQLASSTVTNKPRKLERTAKQSAFKQTHNIRRESLGASGNV